MTREEALEWFKDRKKMNLDDKCQQAEDMAIKALEQEPCEDAISRKALFDMCKKEIDHISKNWQNYHSPSEAKSGFAYIATNIYDLPSVTPQPKTGHWIKDENEMKVWCSECGEENDNCSKCCPNCGVRMIEP